MGLLRTVLSSEHTRLLLTPGEDGNVRVFDDTAYEKITSLFNLLLKTQAAQKAIAAVERAA